MSTIGHIPRSAMNQDTRRFTPISTVQSPDGLSGTSTGRIYHSSTMVRDPRAGRFIVRKTTYDAWRVFDAIIKEWVGNAVEEEHTAKAIARRMERGE